MPNEFQVSIGGDLVFDQTDMGIFGYTQYTFNYTATETTTTIPFGVREDPSSILTTSTSSWLVPVPMFRRGNT